mmetsp:Transcript_11781/g.27960  ORF Transcript_11781/g.27960 Transcript_11781/m.27960 type:complete len:207 (-) Transcript_11781:148-768(-)
MGCFQSREKKYLLKPKQDSLERLEADTNFSAAELRALKQLFGQVSNSVIQDGLIHKEEFFRALFDSSDGNLFGDRIFHKFDSKRNGVIEFDEFVRGLSVFHPTADFEEKIKFAFSIYDKDGSGFICKEEVKDFLFEVMRENSKLHFTDEELDTVIEQTFQEVDLARDNKIHPAEWRSFCIGNPAAINYMTLPVLRDLTARFPEAFR